MGACTGNVGIWYNAAKDDKIMKFKIFISSVQREFAKERKALADYIRKDAILGRFFEVFLLRKSRHRSAQPTMYILVR